MSALKNTIQNLLLVCLSLLFCLLIGELILRALDYPGKIASPQESDDFYRYSAEVHHRFIGNSAKPHKSTEYDYIWKINRHGMSDRSNRDLWSENRKILILGDSMIQGYGVALEDSAVYKLEDRLAALDDSRKVELINGAIFGYSPVLQAVYLDELFETFAPDGVVVVLYLGNDISDDHFYRAFLADPDKSVHKRNADIIWPWSYADRLLEKKNDERTRNRPATEHRSIAVRLKRRLERELKRFKIGQLGLSIVDRSRKQRDERRWLEAMAELKTQYAEDIRVNAGLVNHDVLSREQRRTLWRPTLESLKRMKASCDKRGVPFGLISIPEIATTVSTFEEPSEILGSFADQHGISYLDLRIDLQDYSRKQLVFDIDGHFHPDGNTILADAMFDYLVDFGLDTSE
ncbi:MAG: hypothetical protein HKN42_02395 [Granulosicoccus sp.]|nr:hypothetical protein [Granulosicoccus sp.]